MRALLTLFLLAPCACAPAAPPEPLPSKFFADPAGDVDLDLFMDEAGSVTVAAPGAAPFADAALRAPPAGSAP